MEKSMSGRGQWSKGKFGGLVGDTPGYLHMTP